jgi:hypothetical protein
MQNFNFFKNLTFGTLLCEKSSVVSQPGLTQYPKNYFKINDPPKGKHLSKSLSKLFLI